MLFKYLSQHFNVLHIYTAYDNAKTAMGSYLSDITRMATLRHRKLRNKGFCVVSNGLSLKADIQFRENFWVVLVTRKYIFLLFPRPQIRSQQRSLNMKILSPSRQQQTRRSNPIGYGLSPPQQIRCSDGVEHFSL